VQRPAHVVPPADAPRHELVEHNDIHRAPQHPPVRPLQQTRRQRRALHEIERNHLVRVEIHKPDLDRHATQALITSAATQAIGGEVLTTSASIRCTPRPRTMA